MAVLVPNLPAKRFKKNVKNTVGSYVPALPAELSLKEFNTWSGLQGDNFAAYRDDYHPASLVEYVKGVIDVELTQRIKPAIPLLTYWILREKVNSIELYNNWLDKYIQMRVSHNIVIEYIKEYINVQCLRGFFFAPWAVFLAKSQWGWKDNESSGDVLSRFPAITIQVNTGKTTATNSSTISTNKIIDVSSNDNKLDTV
jgi:hypothetical protein